MSSKVVFPFWLVSGEMMGAFFAGKSELCCIFNGEANNLAPPHLHQHTKKMKKLIKCRFWEICLLKNLLLCQILNNYSAFSIYPTGNHQFIHEDCHLWYYIWYYQSSMILYHDRHSIIYYVPLAGHSLRLILSIDPETCPGSALQCSNVKHCITIV